MPSVTVAPPSASTRRPGSWEGHRARPRTPGLFDAGAADPWRAGGRIRPGAGTATDGGARPDRAGPGSEGPEHPPVDEDLGPVDVAGRLAGQEHADPDHVLGPADAAHGVGLGGPLL